MRSVLLDLDHISVFLLEKHRDGVDVNLLYSDHIAGVVLINKATVVTFPCPPEGPEEDITFTNGDLVVNRTVYSSGQKEATPTKYSIFKSGGTHVEFHMNGLIMAFRQLDREIEKVLQGFTPPERSIANQGFIEAIAPFRREVTPGLWVNITRSTEGGVPVVAAEVQTRPTKLEHFTLQEIDHMVWETLIKKDRVEIITESRERDNA